MKRKQNVYLISLNLKSDERGPIEKDFVSSKENYQRWNLLFIHRHVGQFKYKQMNLLSW